MIAQFIMEAQVTAKTDTEPHQHLPERTARRSGYRERRWAREFREPSLGKAGTPEWTPSTTRCGRTRLGAIDRWAGVAATWWLPMARTDPAAQRSGKLELAAAAWGIYRNWFHQRSSRGAVIRRCGDPAPEPPGLGSDSLYFANGHYGQRSTGQARRRRTVRDPRIPRRGRYGRRVFGIGPSEPDACSLKAPHRHHPPGDLAIQARVSLSC